MANDDVLEKIAAELQRQLLCLNEFKGISIGSLGVTLNMQKSKTKGTSQFDVHDLLQIVQKMKVTVVLLLNEVKNSGQQLKTLFSAYKTYRGEAVPINISSLHLTYYE
jgi:endonuclease/exonuclease/phosphatase family metal-dependent hydrolase